MEAGADLKEIFHFLGSHGPARGHDLCEIIFEDRLAIWRFCKLSDSLITKSVARHYLRLDRNIEGYARLSPSIWREFYSYTVIGLRSQREWVEQMAGELSSKIRGISKEKEALAKSICDGIYQKISYNYPEIREKIAFLLAGDVVYGMAHSDPRPELSTGKLVVGSDIDLVVIVGDEVSNGLVKLLDDMMLEEKTRLILNPFHKEELDYVVKKVGLLRDQMAMKSFKEWVAMKVFWESKLLCGDMGFYETFKADPRMERIGRFFMELQDKAQRQRKEIEEALLKGAPLEGSLNFEAIFYPTDETEDF